MGPLLLVMLATGAGAFELTVLHTNDVHARFEPINLRGGRCFPEDVEANHCFGGAARRLAAVKKIRSEDKNVVMLNGGDEFQGTIWYTVLKWEPIAQVLNALQMDAMAFGNHEFDDGLAGLVPFVRALDFPIVNSNIDPTSSTLAGTFKRSIVKIIGGEQVGIVGYTTEETPDLSNPGPDLRFNDIIRSLREEVAELTRQGINKIIAVGHAGYNVDQKICREVVGIDIVVGGHTNTFLYTGDAPSTEEPQGPYPTVVKNAGSPCLCVQDYAFGKYLGYLKVDFNIQGTLTKWNGNPILLDKDHPEDPEMQALLKPYLGTLERYTKEVIGYTAVGLDGDRTSCRLKECNMGSLLADSAIAAYLPPTGPLPVPAGQWTPVAISMLNGGGVRDFSSDPAKNLTLEDIYTTLPFANTVELIRIKGKYIREALEHSVKDYSTVDSHGKFLQMSGLKVVYNLDKPNGERVHSVLARCANCSIPTYHALMDEEIYPVTTISFLADGGDGYTMLRDNVLTNDHSELLDIDIAQKHIKAQYPLTIGEEGRITFVKDSDFVTYCNAASSSNSKQFLFDYLRRKGDECVFVRNHVIC